MKKKVTKVVTLLLIGILTILMFTACGKKDNNDADSNKSGSNTGSKVEDKKDDSKNDNKDSSQDKEPVAGIEGWEPFEKNVSITIPVYDRGQDGLPAVDNNYWTKWVQENFGDKYNITVNYEPIPRTDVMTKYSLLIAAKNTPTILMEYDYPKVTQWAAEGAMATFNMEDFAFVAPNYYQSMVDNDLLVYTELDGETYYVCAVRPYAATEYKFISFYRLDWLKKVGYDHVPTNREEEVDAMNKIIAAGLTDIEPMNHKLPTANYQANAWRSFPLDERDWVMYADINVAAFSWEPVKEAIRRDNENWHKGFITKEFELNDATTEQANFVAGKTYSYGGYMASKVDWLDAFYENNPDAELAIGTFLYDDNGEVVFDMTDGLIPQERSNTPYGMVIGFSSFATEEQIKAAWMYMEWMKQPEVLKTIQYGIEGIHYTETDELGYPIPLDMSGKEERFNFNDNKDMWCVVIEAKERDTIEDSIAAIAPRGIPQDFTEDMVKNYYVKAKKAENGWIYPDPVFSVPIEAVNMYNASLQSLFQEYYTKLVKCDPADFDTMYEKFRQEYLDAGYQEIIDERLAAYEAGKSTRLPDKSKK
jgi:putative aldouronate transport system substrate-binding protein